MKKIHIIGAIMLIWCFTVGLSGCSVEIEKNSAEISFVGSSYSSEASIPYRSSDYIEGTDNNIGTLKSFNHTIDVNGLRITDIDVSELYLTAMDNDNFFFSSASYPQTISSIARNNHESKNDIMTYDLDVECGFVTSKRTYCGNYVVFPCCGTPSDDYITLRAFVGKPHEQAQCILNQPTSAISVCASELNAKEIVFLCSSKKRGIFNIYKYNFDEEQAQLIYIAELDVISQNSNPLVTCYDGDIYFIYRSNQNENAFCIKRINANGEECDETLLDIPKYSETTMCEFTVTKNNIFIRFEPSNIDGYFQTVMVDKKTLKTFSDDADEGLGVRFNDSLIDGRYILFRAGSKSDPTIPMVCLFDDWRSEFHFIKFTSVDSSKIINTVADFKGDIVFFVREDNDKMLILFENLCSLIASE